MGNQLSQALADAGLISHKSVAKQAAQQNKHDVRQQQKEQRQRHLQTDEGRVEHYSSPAEFLEDARQRLKREGFSEQLMQVIFREAHQFADAKLAKKQRGRLHAFLCQLQEKLQAASPNQQKVMLRDGKRAFQQMNVKNL